MTGPERDEEMREVAREFLRELVPGMLREVIAQSATHVNGQSKARELDDDATVVPRVPAPPVAAVLRPSTWDRPAAPGEIIGRSAPAHAGDPHPSRANELTGRSSPAPAGDPELPGKSAQPAVQDSVLPPAKPGDDARVESVAIDTDEDLERFVRELMSRIENPRERLAIRTGRLRFALRRSPAAPVAGGAGPRGPVTQVEKGAVTERVIRAAAAAGTRLVLAPGAVLTPLARDQAKALGVEIERKRRC
jgi:hypothetical protein